MDERATTEALQRRPAEAEAELSRMRDTEARLRRAELEQRLMLQLVPALTWQAGPDGHEIVPGDGWTLYTGQSEAEVQDFRWLDAVHPEDRPATDAGFHRAFATGQPLELQHRIRRANGAYRWHLVRHIPALNDAGEVVRWYGAAIDVHDLHELKDRQAFLLSLSDALRPIADPVEIQRVATRLLGQQLGASRVFYVNVGEDGDTADILADYTDGVESRIGRYALSGFSTHALPEWRAGRVASTGDVEADPRYSEAEREAYASISVRAGFGVPLIKGGRLEAILGVNQSRPRRWTDDDIALAGEVAERTWAAVERARAEAALRDSEERFRQFANASAAGLWIRDAATLMMEFVSPAIATVYGVDVDALLGDVTLWAAMIVPEDRDAALRSLEEARGGEVVLHEFRVQRPSDGAFRWIRNTDFPLGGDGQVARIGGIAEDVTEQKLAAEHSAVLLAELQHRVRNIMALLRSITDRTAERAESVPEYRDLMMGRLLAFARVQALLTRAANVSVGVRSIVRDEVGVQAQHEGQYVLDGPDVTLSPKAAEVLTLAIHELATNAVKYGALSVPTGRVTVRWSTFERRGGPWLAFDWSEEGAPARPAPGPPRRRGFGSELIEERIPYELRGRGTVTIGPDGARCHLEFPLQDGASVLETGAPQRASVFGGAIDMTGEPDLAGRRVLVVEDDFYLATDAARALRGAGAEVIGPCATEENARAELDEAPPDAAVVDINLGAGPSFKLAEALKDRGIPFVFTTGYDAEVIPAEFAGIERLEKPLQLRQIVGAVARLTRPGRADRDRVEPPVA